MCKLCLGAVLIFAPIFSFATTLPSGYTELEYIHFSGYTDGPYIDTGLKFYTHIPTDKVRFIVDAKVYNSTDYPTLIGTHAQIGVNIAVAWSNGSIYYGHGEPNGEATYTGVKNPGTRCVYDLNIPGGTFVVTNTENSDNIVNITNITTPVKTTSAKILIGTQSNELGTTPHPYHAKMDLYRAKIYNDGVLIRDFIPAKNSSGALGLYDVVNNAFYTNSGTGSFIAGPVVLPCGYTRLEYISTNHDSYILTDLTVNDFDRVAARTTLYDYGSEENITRGFPNLFGARTGAANYQDGKLFRFYDNNIYNGKNITTFSSLYDEFWSEGWPVYTPTAVPLNTAVDYDIKLANGEQYIKINGATVASNTLQGGVLNNPYPVVMFGTNYRGVIKNIPHLDCEYMTFYNGNNIVADFIPAKRNSDNKIGMYDIVSDTFYPLLNTSSGFIIDDNNVDLPCSYTQLEYIESTGTQYIDTGFVYNNNTRVIWDVQLTAILPLSDFQGFGVGYVQNNTERLGFSFEGKDVQKFLLFKAKAVGNPDTRIHTIPLDNDRHVIEVNSPTHKGYVDGVEYTFDSSVGTTDNVTNATLPLFCWYSNIDGIKQYSHYSEAKLYSVKIYDNGTLVRNMIPARRNSDNAVGLYDMANNVFYVNSGTGIFTAGPTIASGNNCQMININWGGLSEPDASGMCVYGETFTAPSTAPTAPSGLKFLGWIPR